MKKFIKHFLVGIMPFLPFEKGQAESADLIDLPGSSETIQTKLSPEEIKKDLERILKSDFKQKQPLAGVDQIEEAIRLADEMVSQENVTTNKAIFSSQESQSVSNNVAFPVVLSEKEDNSSLTNAENVLSSVPESHEEVATNSCPVVIAESDISTNIVESTIATNEESLVAFDDNQPKTVIHSTESCSSKEAISLPSTKTTDKIINWFLLGIGVVATGVFAGKLVRAYGKYRKRNKMTAAYGDRSENTSPSFVIGEMLSQKQLKSSERKLNNSVPSNEEKSSLPQQKTPVLPPKEDPILSSKKETTLSVPQKKKITPTLEITEGSHQEGVRKLANIKLRRDAINHRMKTLRQEIEKYHQSTVEWQDIAREMENLLNERKKLAIEARQARILVKGEEGKRIQEERRLLAKEMRLAKKTNDIERIKTIMKKRLDIKLQEKQILSEALAELKERQETATRWHGIRLFREVKNQEKAFQEKIKRLRKETGLKKKEILEADDSLMEESKDIKTKKSLARKKSKGNLYTSEKRRLAKEIIMAHNNNDIEAENRLKQELQDLKQKEKEYIKQAEGFDYVGARRCILKPAILDRIHKRELEAQQRKKAACLNRKRVRMAQFLRGQRMLRDLENGWVESVNLNQRSYSDYKKEALSLIGKRLILKNRVSRF